MVENNNSTLESAEALRAEFDRAFAVLSDVAREELELVLTLAVDDSRFAIRCNQISSVTKCVRVAPVPASNRALLGLAGVRGELMPVFSLHQLLGFEALTEHRLLLLCQAPARFALALGEISGAVKVPSRLFSTPEQVERTSNHPVVEINSVAHAVVEIPTLAKELFA